MNNTWTFPFGQHVTEVVQTDRTPKKVFVLGVYSSAVHARWIGHNGQTLVNALAVASEPCIFWRGDHAESIIREINVPPALGKLIPASCQFNGPSGIALDELILNPLGIDRKDAWLCDLVPHSCVNPKQMAAIKRAYEPVESQYGLPKHTVPPVPTVWTDDKRREEILAELHESCATTLILLGDLPIKWFLYHFDSRWKKLSDFGDESSYGKMHSASIRGKEISVLPLAHPKQIGRLGPSSLEWYNRHQSWLQEDVRRLLGGL